MNILFFEFPLFCLRLSINKWRLDVAVPAFSLSASASKLRTRNTSLVFSKVGKYELAHFSSFVYCGSRAFSKGESQRVDLTTCKASHLYVHITESYSVTSHHVIFKLNNIFSEAAISIVFSLQFLNFWKS